MESQQFNSHPSVRSTAQPGPGKITKNLAALTAQRNASTFFEKYDCREIQELLSLTTHSWLLGAEDFAVPVDVPPGIIKQMKNFPHTNAIILVPCDSSVPLDYQVVHQIVRELTVGIYCFNQVPSISLEPNFDQSTSCQLSPAYYDTKVGQILVNIDYTMKSLWHGAYIPKEKRIHFTELWRSSMGVDSNGFPHTRKDILAEFLTAGLQDVSDDPSYQGIYDRDSGDTDPTYDPDSAEEQKLFSQFAESVLLKITSYLTSVQQHENLFSFEGALSLSSVFRLTEDSVELSTYQQLQQRLARHSRLVKKHLGRKVELSQDLAYLKLISCLVPLLVALRKKMRIPDLSQMLPPISEDKVKTERELPPLLLGPKFSCRHFSYPPDQYFHLHGGIEFDTGTPELDDITEEIKLALSTLQNQASGYLKDLLWQENAYKKQFPVPLSEINGKRYCVICIELASFYPQHNTVQWWEGMSTVIKTLRGEKLPLTDIQLHELFKKTFGYAKAIKCKSVLYGLRAAAERGLSAAFHTLTRKNSQSHLMMLDERGYSLLHHAAVCNHAHIICQLAAAGINLNQARRSRFSHSGFTALHLAAQCGSLEALNCLLALKADYRLVDQRGWTAVHFAAFYGQVACVQALCRKDPTLLDRRTSAEYHTTPVLLSATSGSVEALDYLLSSGANWRETDSKSNNAVQLAALYFHINILRRFIELDLDDLPVWKILVEMLRSDEHKRLEMGVRCLEALCVNTDSFWKDIMEAGGIAALVEILSSGRLKLQCMAAAVLCHMTENVAVCEELVRCRAVAVLIKLLGGQQPEIHSRCAVILADLAGHSGQYQTHIADLGGVEPVVNLLSSDLQDVLLNAVRCVQALCVGCPSNQTAVARAGGISQLVEFLTVNSEVLQEEVCLALAELARDHTENQELICGAGAVQPLVQVLQTRKMSTQVKAARAIEAIAHQNPAIQTLFQKTHVARYLLQLLKVFHQTSREQGAVSLWALAGDTLKQQKYMANVIGYHSILDMLLSSSDKMQYVGCQAVIALSRESCTHQKILCRENGVPPLVRLLRGSRSTERTLLSAICALRTLCIGVAHTNNAKSQAVIYEENAVAVLLELLQNHESLQVKVQVAQTLACILMGNQKLQKVFWEKEDFSYDTVVELLQSEDPEIRLEAGHALALFACNNPTQQTAIWKRGGVPVRTYEHFLDSDDETERAKAAFQVIVLANVITGSDKVTLTARGITALVALLQSEKPNTVVITAQFLATLAHTRTVSDALVTMRVVEHLTAQLYSKEEEVRTACANALGYLTFNRHAHRILMAECRNTPLKYKLMMNHLAKDGKICSRFTSEFERQRKVGLPSLSLEQNGGPPVQQRCSKGVSNRRSSYPGSPAIRSSSDSTSAAVQPYRYNQRSKTALPRVRFSEESPSISQNNVT
ncbi:ankyrin and armadillo repeat-containing protein [Astyanax mexicanus]|uniref:ankyrin and armadillo repeat-containing protein n=1 Tax=Astyanax mexicanus TaxID=7994 RepID=UPI0020CAB14F|nr:ankyrin and armadillo repeat-containing protein [Astyanax mexicanus]